MINWEAVGAIAELVGALGVIVSLIYLAKQIKGNSDTIDQNTRAVLSSTETSSNDQVIEIMKTQIQDPQFAEVAHKGHADLASLDRIERARYSLLLLSMFETHQTYFIQRARDSAGPEIWEYYSRSFDGYANCRG